MRLIRVRKGTADMTIVAENVSFSYRKGKNENKVLDGVSFSAGQGELVAVLGANGVGKSTLFKCILGILSGYTGSIKIDGDEASKLSAGELAKKVAYIPQIHYPSFSYSVQDMVLMGSSNRISAMSSPGRAELNDVQKALEQLGIERLAERDFSTLSGGEQQLVLMARALVQNAKIWILDEPVASLDFGNRIMVQEQLKKLSGEGFTILMSTHDPEQSYIYADKIVAMKDGRVLVADSPQKVITNEIIRQLYGVNVDVESLKNDTMRVCVHT